MHTGECQTVNWRGLALAYLKMILQDEGLPHRAAALPTIEQAGTPGVVLISVLIPAVEHGRLIVATAAGVFTRSWLGRRFVLGFALFEGGLIGLFVLGPLRAEDGVQPGPDIIKLRS